MSSVPALLPSHTLLLFLTQLGILLLSALVCGRISAHFGLPPLVGELAAGLILGPTLLQKLFPEFGRALFPPDTEQFHLLDGIGQVGVLLLVGIAGSHVSLGLVRQHARKAAAVSTLGLAIPLLCGISLGFMLPLSLLAGSETDRVVFALFVGVALCVSALPVIARTLMDMGFIHREVSQISITAATIDDVIGWFLLSIVAALAVGGLHTSTVIISVAAIVGTIAFAVLVARPVVRLLLRWAANFDDRAVMSALIVCLIMLSAAATHALGLEALLGAFICGILINQCAPDGVDVMGPTRTMTMGVLAPVFFVLAGLRMDLTNLLHWPVAAAAGTVLLVAIVGKFVGAYLGARITGIRGRDAVSIGAAMNARGVVEIVIAMAGLRLGLISDNMFTVIVLVALVTSLMAPLILRHTMGKQATPARVPHIPTVA